MKITIKSGVILSSSKKHTDLKGAVTLQYADFIAVANGQTTAEGFVKTHEGKTFNLDKDYKIADEVRGNDVVPARSRLGGTKKAHGKYIFSQDELKVIAMDLANKQLDEKIVEDEKKSVMSKFKDRLDQISLDLSKLSRCYRDGYDYKEIECYVDLDWTLKKKLFSSVASGELISSQDLCPSDYQLTLNMDDKKQ
jgi:hypothetical protein